LLNGFQAGSLLDMLGGKGVPEAMNGGSFYPSPLQILSRHLLYYPWAYWLRIVSYISCV